MGKKITIKDIAKVANVSIGTVDRVLHKRGKVSKNSLQKVNEALRELNYKPNPLARSLKNNRTHFICILVPDPKKDPYWLPCKIGIEEVVREYDAFDITVSVNYFDPSKPDVFAQTGFELLKKNPNAFLFVPLFEKESRAILKDLDTKGIRTVTFNSLPQEYQGHHVGQDLYLSGRVGAKLISTYLSSPSKIGLIHIDETYNNATHIREKENGFKSFFKDEQARHEICIKSIKLDSVPETVTHMVQTLKINIFFVTTSKTYEVARCLDMIKSKSIVIGYDLLPQNLEYLKNGRIQFLIHQAPGLQASLSLKQLIENSLFNKEFPEKRFLPIDIINSENYKCYL